MSTPDNSFKSLPVFVTNDSSTTIPDAFKPKTNWEIRGIQNPEKLRIEEIHGSWALCSLWSNPDEPFWTNLAGSQYHGWFEIK
jgi:hypothetical protein